ncbi:MAG TPA: DUF6229 family protein [Jatrophihabitans sp.]|jgi:hypothetical protein|uniref:DUF6229 family protein n=1 Tax=Jatrophihabitans sp. TaxID=1932789 RepID=UPI002EF77345
MITSSDSLIAAWRTSAEDNPAGPLFSTPFAEADLTSSDPLMSSCSWCSASRTAQCC